MLNKLLFFSQRKISRTHVTKSLYIRKWLCDDEREKDKLLHDRCFKFNEKYPSNIEDKKLCFVINSYIREKRQNGSNNVNKEIDYDKLLKK